MVLNRKHFEAKFYRFPPWRCPSCGDGTLSSIKNARSVVETGPSRKEHARDEWEPDWIQERFTDMLQCSNATCEELVAVSGHTRNSWDYFHGPDGETETDLTTFLVPTGFDPAPLIIEIPSKVPDDIKEVFRSAFSLFWQDKEACANKLRISVELLMDDLKIPAKKKGKDGRERPLSLDSRLTEYATISKEISDLLLAVKWIGNAGSHASLSKLDSEDLLNVLEILELVLEENYIGRRKRLAAIADAINAAKGKPEKVRRRGMFD